MQQLEPSRPAWILPAIVVAQLLATSLWFATNAIIGELQQLWGLPGGEGVVTTAVQLGFIGGTLVYAFFALADRYPPGAVFLISALLGATANAAVLLAPERFGLVLALRFVVGFCLAGVYPVGMKMAAAWYRGGLGRALGLLVGALVLGTAAPHLLREFGASWDWRAVLLGTSAAAVLAGALAWAVPEGPYLKRGGRLRFRDVLAAFRVARFRAAAGGYFGHMWEVYAFWAFVPVWIAAYGQLPGSISGWSFAAIGIGALGCAGGGFLAHRLGSGRIALGQLGVSGLCCLISPLLFFAPPALFALFLLVWGVAVAGDSPQFSALNAQNAPPQVVGAALTLTNCFGFAISIGSLALLEWVQLNLPPEFLLLPLTVGPVAGLAAGRLLFAAEPVAAR